MVLRDFMNKKVLVTLILIISLVPAFAQDTGGEPAAILVYADDEYEIEILDSDGMAMDAYIGMDLLAGDTIKTFNSTVELQLEPNGSIIKLSESTNFRVDGFQTDLNSSNDFSLIAGKIRAVAARSSTRSANYNIYTQSTVCGVRGTDFLVGGDGKLLVGEGSVEFIKTDTGESLMVNSGMYSDAAAATFSVIALTAEQLAEQFEAFSFEVLDPFQVEGHSPPPEEPAVEEEVEEEEPAAEDKVVLEQVDTAEPAGEAPADETEESKEPSALEKFLAPIGEFLGMEIGSFTVDGNTYSKLLLQPEFAIGDLQMALYLPVIYNNDVFNPDDWYHPAGNDEWSFGTDKDEVKDIAMDALSDLFLKIRYVKWGEQRDPFFFKLGNLNDMTIGHGILMMNYANDADFPAVRKVGMNMGITNDKMAFEFVADDLANPQIFGGRLAFGNKVKFGLSTVLDMNPELILPSEVSPGVPNPVYEQEPQFVNFGLDLDFSIVESDFLSLIMFTDVASMLPIIDGLVKAEYLFDSSLSGDISNQIRNYGAAAGFMGNILGADFKLQYLFGNGLFRHGFYNSTYDRMKGEYLTETLAYLDSPTAESLTTHGVYGSINWDIAGIVDVSGGYKWPWNEDGFDFNNDYFHFRATLKPDVIPVVGIYGSFIYTRTNLVGSIQDNEFSLVDANTVMKGEIVVPVAPSLDMALLITSALERDSDGEVVYEDGKANAYYAFTVDTRIHF